MEKKLHNSDPILERSYKVLQRKVKTATLQQPVQFLCAVLNILAIFTFEVL